MLSILSNEVKEKLSQELNASITEGMAIGQTLLRLVKPRLNKKDKALVILLQKRFKKLCNTCHEIQTTLEEDMKAHAIRK